MQLDLFTFVADVSVEQEQEVQDTHAIDAVVAPSTPTNPYDDVLAVFDLEVPAASMSIEHTPHEHAENTYVDSSRPSYQLNDVVKVDFDSVAATDSEVYDYLEAYYSHLKGRKGRIVEVLPCKKLQYRIAFDVKHEDNELIMYHMYLEWISN